MWCGPLGGTEIRKEIAIQNGVEFKAGGRDLLMRRTHRCGSGVRIGSRFARTLSANCGDESDCLPARVRVPGTIALIDLSIEENLDFSAGVYLVNGL